MASKVNGYESTDLPRRHQIALRFADALMTQPAEIINFAEEVRVHFSDDEIIELTLDVMKWNYQKVAVALGVDVEVVPGELTGLTFDEAGHHQFLV